ncbi:ATP-binding protein [Cryobacterium sp. PAMC25264]|uniref:ATP-binding protein n=1 Tax=Cryobacterium sp. PAMC25264 TaxID=2861288 RepID=UPI001C63429F|nr:ATP-binding protein [Cryobacterium sp. PAMC25264]QYF74427.1 ATP-binding protein [Cryobacterium sp. PAMC25264]
MGRFKLEAAADHVQGLAHEGNVVRAVLELIWNGLDADASRVDVSLHRNESDGIVGVTVSDTGHGMSLEAAESAFRWIGGSWKRAAGTSQEQGRPLHGKSGQGRLRAFALGTEIRWTTVADDSSKQRMQVTIRASSANRNDFEISAPKPSSAHRGTEFEASGKFGLDRLESEDARAKIVSDLAPYLIARPQIEVVYDGRTINPAENIELDTTKDIVWEFEGKLNVARLRIIEWVNASRRSIHLCDAAGMSVDELDSAPAPDFRYSAYAMWEAMHEHQGEWLIAGMEGGSSEVGGLIEVTDRTLKEHFIERRSQRRRQLIEEWKVEKTYPYQGEPQTDEQELERAAFDVVATTIRQYVPKGKKQQKLTLGLLKESLQQRPADVSELLDQFLGLPAEEREQLDRLLKRTSLSRVIRATTSVTNRLEFLRALELMVFDPEARKVVGERENLHKILENELWLFGEEFNLMVSERGLTNALDRHLDLLGETRSDKTAVRRLDGTSGRLDLLLSVAASEHDRNRHLVVELKAPKVEATEKELSQIKSYAKAVAGDPRFADSNTIWDFWLITSTVNDDVQQERTQRNRARGIVFEPDLPNAPQAKVRVWVKTWGELIEEATRRLSYFQESLHHDTSLEDAREYLARNHGDVVPEGLMTGGSTPRAGGADENAAA